MNQPPDKYKILKIPLNKIIKNTKSIPIFTKTVFRVNKLIIHTYQFLRLWILYKYHNNTEIPIINDSLVHMAIKALVIDATAGPKPKGEKKKIYDEFVNFYEKQYKNLGYFQKIDGINLSAIIGYTTTSIVTAIENNIKLNFFNYVKRFVNSSFAKDHREILEKYKGKEKIKIQKMLRKELYQVKEDLINNTKLSELKYHLWIDKHRSNIAPVNTNKICHVDIKAEPQSFLPCMIYMNIQLEQLEAKLFQFFPLRTNIIPKYIPIDTKSIVELLVIGDTKKYLDDIAKYTEEIWNRFFNMNNPIFKMKNYKFNYSISTDGTTASIQFLHNSLVEKNKKDKEIMKEARNNAKIEKQFLSQEEKDNLKKQKEIEKKRKQKEERDKKKEEFNKLSAEEKKILKEKQKKQTYVEFPYLDELNEQQLSDLKDNSIYIDPGKRDLLTMLNDNDKMVSYSNKQYMHETKRLKYQRLIKNYKDRKKISIIENQLSEYNSKSCSLIKFKEYIFHKNRINELLFVKYSKPKFRQYKWYAFINKKRAYAKLLDFIEKEFSLKDNITGKYKKLNIVIGDWSIGKQMRNFISTPMISLKRKLRERFNVYNIDEYNTSKLNYVTENKCKNFYYTDKKNKLRKLHSVLTYKMENNRKGCINRDVNSVYNMKKLVKYWLDNKDRPDKYKHQKPANPITLSVVASNVGKPLQVQFSKGKTPSQQVTKNNNSDNKASNEPNKVSDTKSTNTIIKYQLMDNSTSNQPGNNSDICHLHDQIIPTQFFPSCSKSTLERV